MNDTPQSRAARLPHLRREGLTKGDPVPLPLTMASIYHLPGDPAGFNQYGRFDNPTWRAVETLLGHLESAEALSFPSGMAATSAALFALLKTGDRILLPSDGYYMKLDEDVAGLGGDNRFIRNEGRADYYYSLRPDVVLNMGLGAGYIFGILGEDVHIANRFFLGLVEAGISKCPSGHIEARSAKVD